MKGDVFCVCLSPSKILDMTQSLFLKLDLVSEAVVPSVSKATSASALQSWEGHTGLLRDAATPLFPLAAEPP